MVDLPECDEWVAVGSVTEQSVRLWFRSRRPGPLELALWPDGGEASSIPRWPVPIDFDASRDGTGAFTYPDDIAGAPQLVAGRRYRFLVRHARAGAPPLGSGRFTTAPPPSAAGSFAFALWSCHQPFRDDGSVSPRAASMLELTRLELQRRDVAYALLLGDQIYSDHPKPFSLFAPGAVLERHLESPLPHQQIRAAYQRRYRQFCQPGFGALLADRPTYVTIDDHELVDNWGSLPEHRTPPWRPLRAGALDAAFDYQLSRNLPEARRAGPYHQVFRWGPCATFIADMRSERWTADGKGDVMSEAQLSAFADFLARHEDCAALFAVFSVPIVFLPGWFMQIGLAARHPAAFDRWSWAGWQRHRERVLDLLFEQRRRRPYQHLVLLSGDVHESMALALHPNSRGMPIHQFVSSPLTNRSKGLLARLAHTASRMTRSIEHRGARLRVETLPGFGGATINPYRDLNVGIVELETREARASLRYRVLGLAHGGRGLEEVFDSGALMSGFGAAEVFAAAPSQV